MKAYNLTRKEVHYRHECFTTGLQAAGFEVSGKYPAKADPGDVLLIWNRYGGMHDIATKFEKAGGTVVVAENGYLGRDANGHQFYALSKHAHNGRGQWNVGGPERFDALGIDLKPWRIEGKHILVCPNRSFGTPGGIMPPNWSRDIRVKLQKFTRREIRVRPHPCGQQPKRPLEDDLRDAWAVVIWGSSCGVHSLIAGIPVICEAPWWICKESAEDKPDCVEKLLNYEHQTEKRLKSLHQLAWAQWSLEEIQNGEAFNYLLHTA